MACSVACSKHKTCYGITCQAARGQFEIIMSSSGMSSILSQVQPHAKSLLPAPSLRKAVSAAPAMPCSRLSRHGSRRGQCADSRVVRLYSGYTLVRQQQYAIVTSQCDSVCRVSAKHYVVTGSCRERAQVVRRSRNYMSDGTIKSCRHRLYPQTQQRVATDIHLIRCKCCHRSEGEGSRWQPPLWCTLHNRS